MLQGREKPVTERGCSGATRVPRSVFSYAVARARELAAGGEDFGIRDRTVSRGRRLGEERRVCLQLVQQGMGNKEACRIVGVEDRSMAAGGLPEDFVLLVVGRNRLLSCAGWRCPAGAPEVRTMPR
ncbi:hypothetical protein VR45_36820 [Streptomyces sp. NRRL S-495]|nr:hypothetical protein VR45_36820 [Streptomyces sp. NRRL S-495]